MKAVTFLLVCVVLFLSCQVSFGHDAIVLSNRFAAKEAAQFNQWRVDNKRSYDSEAKRDEGLENFVANLRKINRHNEEGHGWEMGLNQFSDMTFDEFEKLYLGAPQNCSATTSQRVYAYSVPSRIDWREKGNYVTAVKNQGHCGSCWTFSTTGCLESATAIHARGNPLYTLSEQQLIDCATAFQNLGCNGGLPSHAFEYIKYNKGLESETDYPYIGKNSDCKFNPSMTKGFVSGIVNITEYDEESLTTAVGSKNPVSVAFQVTPDFMHYKSGVYSNPDCKSLPSKVNHAVLAVGYDVDESGKKYWIIKNSWGPSFGIKGYFHMERGVNMCGVATCASYPIVT